MAVNQRSTRLPAAQLTLGSFPRITLYARVSTSGGHQDPEMQLRELREYAERRGWEITETYTDAGISGSKDSRPALNRLMAAWMVWSSGIGSICTPIGKLSSILSPGFHMRFSVR